LLPSLRRLSGYGLIWASGFTLAVFIQLKMALNNYCSPDLSNDRRQNDVASDRKINNDGVVLTPSIGQCVTCLVSIRIPGDLVELTGIEPVTSCLQSRRSPN
jgi:hypothetical protein